LTTMPRCAVSGGFIVSQVQAISPVKVTGFS
jgi:hypothetical protein